MLLRLGKSALTVSFLLVGATLATAQSPLYVPGNMERSSAEAHMALPGAVPIGAVEQLSSTGRPIKQVQHSTTCNFDPYQSYHEGMVGERHMNWREKHITGGFSDCQGCGTCGKGGGLGWFGKIGDENCPDFECANCWAAYDVEKRFIFMFGHGNAHKPATQAGYGDNYAGMFTTEVLPWVITDGDSEYTRWGISTMFGWYRTQGNRAITLQSDQTGRTLNVNSSEILNLTIGPTIRSDFFLGKMRISPNVMGGIAFDWTDISEIRPIQGVPVRDIDYFKYAGFDVGGYVRLMLDFGITKKMNIGVGIDYKATPTNVMLRADETRKFLGFILAISHEF